MTENEWEDIKNRLHQEFLKMTEYISQEQDFNSSTATILLGALAHAAYPLGAIRQMVKSIK